MSPSLGARIQGLPTSPGCAVGKTCHIIASVLPPNASEQAATFDASKESTEFSLAAQQVADELREIAASATDSQAQEILTATALMAQDTQLTQSVLKRIQQHEGAVSAVWHASAEIAAVFTAAGGVLAERVHDIEDVRDRLVSRLRGQAPPGLPELDEETILVATDLSPAQTAQLDTTKVVGLITATGGTQSHSAILARALGIPAVVVTEALMAVPHACNVFVDGDTGEVSTQIDNRLRSRAEQWREGRARVEPISDPALGDGTAVTLLANIADVAQAEVAAQYGAQGVGLYRTEFAFIDRQEPLSQTHQVKIYRDVACAAPAGKFVIRTLDAGTDKPVPFLKLPTEANPALGVRGFRVGRTNMPVLTEQLDAIALAQQESGRPFEVMAPMVSTVEEATAFARLCRDRDIQRCGVMIEVPAAALQVSDLLKVVDFASVGTNDLVQYTMAVDRQATELSDLLTYWNPAVLRLLQVIGAANQESGGDRISVCGEAAGDPLFAVVLCGFGLRSLSMSARMLPQVAQQLARVTRQQAEQVSALAVSQSTSAQAHAVVQQALVQGVNK